MEVGDVSIVADCWMSAFAVVEKVVVAAVAGHIEGPERDMEDCLSNDGGRYCHCCQPGIVVEPVATAVAGDCGCGDEMRPVMKAVAFRNLCCCTDCGHPVALGLMVGFC